MSASGSVAFVLEQVPGWSQPIGEPNSDTDLSLFAAGILGNCKGGRD